MKIMKRPVHPGEIIKHDYLEPLELTVGKLAEAIGVTRPMISAVINGRSSVSPEMAIRLSKTFDTTADLWLGMQKNYDLYKAGEKFNPDGVVKQLYSNQFEQVS